MTSGERIDWETIGPALAGFARVALVAGLSGLAVAELLLRLAGLPTGATQRPRNAYDVDDRVPGPYRPGARIEQAWPPETAYRATFNSWGMRGAEPRQVSRSPQGREAAAQRGEAERSASPRETEASEVHQAGGGAPPILALGDSQTFGFGVQDGETWPARLDENLAAAGRPHPVLNLASPHLLIDDEIRYLEAVLPRYRPAVIVWMMPSFGYPANQVGIDVTPHQRSFARERRTRERWAGFVSHSALREARDWSYLWRDRVARAARGEVLAAPPLVANDEAPGQRPGREHFLARLPVLEELVAKAGAKLLVAAHPQIAVANGHVALAPPWVARVARERGIPTVDLYTALRETSDLDALFLLPWDTHPSPLGHARIARAVQSELERLGWIE